MANRVILATLFIQLAGIFLMSIAAEYRYLLMFFYSPLLLVPVLHDEAGHALKAPSGADPAIHALSSK